RHALAIPPVAGINTRAAVENQPRQARRRYPLPIVANHRRKLAALMGVGLTLNIHCQQKKSTAHRAEKPGAHAISFAGAIGLAAYSVQMQFAWSATLLDKR